MSAQDAAALVERVRVAVSRPIANVLGGCIKPESRSQRGECADGDCYCARLCRHIARAALAEVAAGLDPVALGAAASSIEEDWWSKSHDVAALLRALAAMKESPDDGR